MPASAGVAAGVAQIVLGLVLHDNSTPTIVEREFGDAGAWRGLAWPGVAWQWWCRA